MDLNEYDDIIKQLTTILVHQDTINQQQILTNRRLEETQQDIHALLQHQGAVNASQALVNTQNTTLIMRIARTLDRIDEKLELLVPPRA